MARQASYIKSRKHTAKSTVTCTSLVAAVTIGLPLAAQAAPADSFSTLPTITSHAETDNGYKADKVSSNKFTEKLVNTTQTVAVISKQVIADQGATTLTEALRNVPGVGAFNVGENGAINTGDAVSIRGADVSNSIFVDGMRDLGNVTRDVFNTEQVEVYKGSSGTDNGRTAATGSINLVSKEAQLKNAYSGTLGYGSDDFYRGTADINQKINETTAIRVNAMGENSNGQNRDVVDNKKWGAAASLGFGLGTDTRAFVDFMHIEQNNIPDGGVSTVGMPHFNAGAITGVNQAAADYLNSHKVNPSTFYGSSSDYDDSKADMATIRIEHDISEKTKLSSAVRWGRMEHQYALTSPFQITPNLADPSQSTVGRMVNASSTANSILTNQTNLQTSFNTGSLEHTVSTGVELANEEMKSYSISGTAAPTSLYNPDHLASVISTTPAYTDATIDTYSVYAFDTIKFSPQWSVNGGVRLDNYHLKSVGVANTAGRGQKANYQPFSFKDSGNLFNWKLGALFKPTENGSIYASYSVQQQAPGTITGGDGIEGNNPLAPNTTTANSGNNLSRDPQKTNNYEVGVKWELFDKRLLLTSALYYTELTNLMEQDALNANVYYQTGKKTIKGVELGAAGQITDNWNVSAGYTHQDAKNKDLATTGEQKAADGSDTVPFTPADAFTLWSTYKTAKWSVGAGTNYTGKMTKANDGNKVGPSIIDDYWVANAMASYQVTKNVGLQFNVNNIFDKDYVSRINRGGMRYFPGAERNYRLTLNFNF